MISVLVMKRERLCKLTYATHDKRKAKPHSVSEHFPGMCQCKNSEEHYEYDSGWETRDIFPQGIPIVGL